LRGQSRITEDNVGEMLREVRMALLEADVALPVVRDFIARVKEKALGREVLGSLQPGQVLVSIVNQELAATMGQGVSDINLAVQPPAVILMAGLQGAGKTTTTAKLAKHLIDKRKKKVLTVSGDVYRPAAIEQLKTVTAQAGAEFFPSSADQKPVAIALAALDYAKRHFFDVLLVDTAGRLAIDEVLKAFAVVNDQLVGQTWACGSRWSAVDAYQFWVWRRAGQLKIYLSAFSALNAHGARMGERESVKKALAFEAETLAKAA